jgi:alpha-beta hydrolase superfamily lysophospholipase
MTNNINIKRTPLYFGEQKRSIFGWYHAPKNTPTNLAIVICPPIGYEYIHSHRTLRHLADNFARSGIACLRIDYHGTGDSSGVDEDSSRVTSWLESINKAIIQVKTLSLCHDVGLIGFRIGATLATIIAENTDLACLILWSPCIKGRNYIREMKALRMSSTKMQESTSKDIESAGFVLSAETVDDLNEIDLQKTIPRTRKILAIIRDDLSEASQNLDQWQKHDVYTDYLKFSGYDDIVAPADATKVPFDTITKITSWTLSSVLPSLIDRNPTTNPSPESHSSMPISNSILVETTEYEIKNLNQESIDIKESIHQFGHNGNLFGILSEPLTDDLTNRPVIILSNSGAVHHIGQHRLSVLLARNLARTGFRCLRMDLSGLGDSYIEDSNKENDVYVPSSSTDIEEAIKSLQQNGTSFVIMGLCSGAHTAFHVAIDLPSLPIKECILINPATFYWKEGMSLSNLPSIDADTQWHYYKNTMWQKERWMKLILGKADTKAIFYTIREKSINIVKSKARAGLKNLNIMKPIPNDLNDDLLGISHTGRVISFIFSSSEIGYDILMSNAKGAVKKLTKNNMMSIQFIQDADHTFTMNKHRLELANILIKHLKKRYMEL